MIRALWQRVVTPERQRFIRFAVVGVSGVVVNLGFVALGRLAFAEAAPAARDFLSSGLGIVVSIFTNFILNDYWTWGDRKKGTRRRDFLLRMAAYYAGAAFAAGLQFATFALFYSGFGVDVYIAQLVGIALGTVVNYVINNRLVFRDKQEPKTR